MPFDPTLKMFWLLIAAILFTNAGWFFYVSLIEDEISAIYKTLEQKPLTKQDKKNLNKLLRRK
jgi:hypothetical protein